MIRFWCILSMLGLVFALLPVQSLGSVQVQSHAQEEDPFAVAIKDDLPQWLNTYHVPGAIVASIRNGEVAWVEAYGFANARTDEPMQPEMIVNLGSTGKVLTAWGVMRLVEMEKIDLDAPVNRYLKRWQVASDEFDPDGVTVRRLLSHTAGLTAPGFSDYSPGRTRPSLVEMLEGKNQQDGPVVVAWTPGAQFHYSGGGFVLLQMMIEDVTGETFAGFMQREIATPLGLESLQWAWTAELQKAAAMPHGSQGEPVGYRQLASEAIGSELCTVADFAHFIAAAVEGPGGEPAGRGVLAPETVQEMLTAQPGAGGEAGLAYGLASAGGSKTAMHFGSNLGWNAFFILDIERRVGLVMATNSANGFPLLTAVQNLWMKTVQGASVNVYPPASDLLGIQGRAGWIIVGVLGGWWALAALVFAAQLGTGRRQAGRFHPLRLLGVTPWALLALFWWYWLYSPNKRLLPPTFPDVWPLPQADYVLIVLLSWVVLSTAIAMIPRRPRA
jgi:CubicO group peptidase (beta-lactamase class C family)